MNNKIIAIISIILLTLLTRFIGLDWVPPHLSNDEISIAYDAYSVSKTLRDSSNHFLPLSFRSWGDYKPPLTIYLTIPTTILLGNNDYSARLPSAILGSFTVLLVGLIVYELSRNYLLALISSGILAITPWHIYSSRMILETNIALFFVALGIYLFFYSLRSQNKFTILGSYLSFALSIYTYHTEKGFVPLLFLSLGILYGKTLIKKPASYLGIGFFALLLIPLAVDFYHNNGTNSRVGTEIIFKDPSVAKQLSNNTLNIFQKGQVVIKAILGNYSNYTNPGYFFFNGLGLLPKEDPFQVGLFLTAFLPSLTIGLFNIKRYFANHSKFIYSWLIISPIIPALTFGEVSNPRNLVSILPFTITMATGSLIIWNYLGRNILLKIGTIFLLAVSFIYFIVIYYYHFPFENGLGYQYGYKQIAQYIKPRYNQFDKIIIDPRFGYYNIYSGVPVWYVPYYTNLDARLLLQARYSKDGTFFGKYEIRDINWNLEVPKHSYLYVVPVINRPTTQKLQKLIEINLPNHKPAFDLYTF